jgi:4-hydroxyphenylpyruvate dioxygenase
MKSDSPINEHVKKHGDGVKILALWVDDAYAAFEETTKRGGKPYLEPVTLTDENGEVRMSGIYTYGETVHMFIERKIITGLSCQVMKNGKVITILKMQVYCM